MLMERHLPDSVAVNGNPVPHATAVVGDWQVPAYRWPSSQDHVPIVFINGMEERWDYCAGVASALADHYQPFSVELPWAGSQGNRWGRHRTAAEWIAAALDLIPGERSVVVAHSFGANALLSYLDRFGSDRIRAAVFVSPFYKRRSEDVDWTLLRFYVDEFQRLIQSGLHVRPEARRLSSDLASAMAARVRDRIGAYGWLQFFDLFTRTPDLALERMQIPCLVTGGADDFAATPEDAVALAAALPHGAADILHDVGHFCMTEQPARVANAIGAFLRTHLNTFNPSFT